MGRREDANRQYDKDRYAASPWRKLYGLKAWKVLRARKLKANPTCEPCAVMGMSRIATVVNHKLPHGGDRYKFFHGPLESCCKNCHDQAIQRAEGEGFRRDIGEDGFPTDPDHPFNKDLRT